MQPVVAAVGAILVSMLRSSVEWPGIRPGPIPFAAGTAGASVLAFLIGAILIPRFAERGFGRLASLSILSLQAAVIFPFPLPLRGTVWEGAAAAAGLVPAFSCFLAVAAGSYAPVGRPRGFAFRDWLALRLFLLPQAVLLVLPAVVTAMVVFPDFGLAYYSLPVPDTAMLLLFSLILFLVGPSFLRFLFPARKLSGPLADRLAGFAQRARVRYRAVLVWDTRTRPLLTACVAGVVRWNRYVFFTEGLLRALEPEEIEAVFAHELSHVRSRHLPILFAFVLGGFGLYLGLLDPLLGPSSSEGLSSALFLAWLGVFFLGPFARVSRILELDADLGALRLGADPLALTQSLEKLGVLSGKIGKRHSWRHFSIPSRIRAIEAWRGSDAFKRTVRLMKRGALATIALVFASGVLFAWRSGAFRPYGEEEILLRKARFLLEQARLRPQGGGEGFEFELIPHEHSVNP